MLVDLRWASYPQLWAVAEREAALQDVATCPVCGGDHPAREVDGVQYVCTRCDGRGVIPVYESSYSVIGPAKPVSAGIVIADGAPAGEPLYTLQAPDGFMEYVEEGRIFSSQDEARQKAMELLQQSSALP